MVGILIFFNKLDIFLRNLYFTQLKNIINVYIRFNLTDNCWIAYFVLNSNSTINCIRISLSFLLQIKKIINVFYD